MNPQEMESRKETLIGQLATLYSRDRVDMETFEELVAQVHACETPIDIDALVAARQDLFLPVPAPGRAGRSPALMGEPMVIQGSMSNMQRTGRWVTADSLRIDAHMSGIVLDFREYEGDTGFRMNIEVQLQMSNLKVYVPSGWKIDADEVGLTMSNIKNKPRDHYGAEGYLRFTGTMGMSNIKIRYR